MKEEGRCGGGGVLIAFPAKRLAGNFIGGGSAQAAKIDLSLLAG